MSKLATLVVAVGALALAFVTLSPNSAEAGWRRWGWGPGPGVNVYVGPRHGWYGYRPYYGPYAYHHGYHTAITPIGADATGAAGIRHAADLASPRVAPHARANEGCRLSPQGGGPSFLLAEIERLTAT